jgi:outer membrane protein
MKRLTLLILTIALPALAFPSIICAESVIANTSKSAAPDSSRSSDNSVGITAETNTHSMTSSESRSSKAAIISELPPASIWDLYLSAKANDPALGRTESRVLSSKADSDVLLSTLMPHLDSSAGIKQAAQTYVNYTPTDQNYNFTTISYNVTARITLLHVPTLYSLSAAAAGLNSDMAGVAAARQNLIVKFTDAYFSLLKAQTDIQIAVGEINRLKRVLDQSQAFLKTGTGDIIAVYEAQSRLDGAVADLTRNESTLRLAEQKLSTVVGNTVTSISNYLPQHPKGPDPDNIDWWVATMEREQPVLRQAREGLNQSSEQRRSVKSEYLPLLQANGGYDVSSGTALFPTAQTRQWYVGATISLPLYSGGETSAKIRRAVATEEERRFMYEETRDQLRENVKQAYFNLRYNISLIKALEQKKSSAEIQLAAVNKGRTIGTRNAIDLLNAEQGYSIALRDYKYALYDNFIRGIQLKSAAGILVDADVSDIAKEVAPLLNTSITLLTPGVTQ